MDCKVFDEYISLCIDQLLDEQDKKNFELHLNQCSQCKEKYEETRELVSLIRGIDEEPLPRGFRNNLIKKLERSQKINTGYLLRWLGAMAGIIVIFLSVKAIKDTRFTGTIDKEMLPIEGVAEDMASTDSAVEEFAHDDMERGSSDMVVMEDNYDSGEITALDENADRTENTDGIDESIMTIQSDLVEVYVQDICITPHTLMLMANNHGLELIENDEDSVVIDIRDDEERSILYRELSKMGEVRDIGENIGSNEVKIIIKSKNE
jgi:hypothetical protein